MITNCVQTLSPIDRDKILTAPRTAEAHRDLMRTSHAMNSVQIGGTASSTILPAKLSVAAWNVERCFFPEQTAAHLTSVTPHIVLLSEVDHGMARTGQRHTSEVVAAELGMTYAFGVEFHELDLGGPTERPFCKDDFNALGWHGNAILSSVPFSDLAMIRLDDHGHWFASDTASADPQQPRLGGRMALAAIVQTLTGPLCIVSTHLESNADAHHRHAQFVHLLDALDEFAPHMPILVGGDLNTGNHLPPDFDWRDETLLEMAQQRGYSWASTADGPTTRPSLITLHPERVMKLDWFASRGLNPHSNGILSSVADGKPLSDHDCIWCVVETPST